MKYNLKKCTLNQCCHSEKALEMFFLKMLYRINLYLKCGLIHRVSLFFNVQQISIKKMNFLSKVRYLTTSCVFTLVVLGIFISCNKEKTDSAGTDDEYGNNPKSIVPDELVGYWLTGETSISNFWDYNGSYQGAANELAVGYLLYKDGRAKEYFYYTSTSTYCRDQVLGCKEGTVKIDPVNKTFEMFYANGTYRGFNSCGSSKSPGFGETKNYTSSELYPAKKMTMNNWSLKEINGKIFLHVPLGNGVIQEYEKSTEPQK